MGLGAKLIMIAIAAGIFMLLMDVLSPPDRCDDEQVQVDTIAGIACMPRTR